MLDHEATGQQSLSCQKSVPEQRARIRRQCSTPTRTASAWSTCVT